MSHQCSSSARTQSLVLVAAALLLLGGGEAAAAGRPELVIVGVETAVEKAERLEQLVEEGQYTSLHQIRVEGGEYTPFTQRIPGQDAVQVVTLVYDPENGLVIDLYFPPHIDLDSPEPATLPVMLLPQGFNVAYMESYGLPSAREQHFMMGWGMFFAMQGTVAVTYDTHDLQQGFDLVMEFLELYRSELGLDLERLGIFGSSAHGEIAGRMIGHELVRDRLDAGVFVHGDMHGSRLNNTSASFIVVYSRDGSDWHHLGAAFARRVTMRRLSVIEIDDASHKNFFYDDYSDRSLEIMDQIGEFVVETLGSTPAY